MSAVSDWRQQLAAATAALHYQWQSGAVSRSGRSRALLVVVAVVVDLISSQPIMAPTRICQLCLALVPPTSNHPSIVADDR